MSKVMIQGSFEDVSAEYKDFVDKFKPKKTTDDCYTPDNIYAAVLDWASKKYGFNPQKSIRPFWPGGDYQRETYPYDCVVVDNPPFSIMTEISRFYNANGIRFFLFAPALTVFSGATSGNNNYICCGASITYENGAVVSTSFITNMGDFVIETAPELLDIIKKEDEKNRRENKRELPKYKYPDAIVTAASMNYLCVHHTYFKVKREDCCFIRKMDAQCGSDKALFGGGFLLTERAAAERAAAERAAAERAAAERAAARIWELSPREKEIQRFMAKHNEEKE